MSQSTMYFFLNAKFMIMIMVIKKQFNITILIVLGSQVSSSTVLIK